VSPPAGIALSLLKLTLPGHEREFLVGDLEEQYFEHILPRYGRLHATLWLWRAAFSLLTRYGLDAIRHGKTREVDVVLDAERYRRRTPAGASPERKGHVVDQFGQYLHYALRQLRRNPGFSALVVLILALGIGANISIFGLVNAILIRPLPYPESDRLVTINHYYPPEDLMSNISVRGFLEYRDTIESLERVAVTTGWAPNLTGLGPPERLTGGRVTWDYFDVFGVAPSLGRTFTPEEDVAGASNVVILSDGFWKSRFGADPGVIGQTIQLNGQSYDIVGVMPQGFRDYFSPFRVLWSPLALTPDQLANTSIIQEWLTPVARLAEDVTLEAAQAEMDAKAAVLREEGAPFTPEDWSLPVTPLIERARSGYRSPFLLLGAAVALVLLLTCANIANMLLARSIRRRKEIAVRRAIGAGRSTLIGMLLAESAVLAGLGSLAGLVFAWWGLKAIVAFGPAEFGILGIGIDATVILFTLLITLVTGVVFGLAPAVQVSRTDIQGVLREGGQSGQADRSGARLRSVLVAAEFAMALLVLTGAGLLVRTIHGLQRIETGFDPRNLLSLNINLPASQYSEPASQIAFWDEVEARLGTLPGVQSAAMVSHVPFSGNWGTTVLSVEGYFPDDDHPQPWGDIRLGGPGFEQTLGLPLLRGRSFELSDGPDTRPVAIVDEEFADRFWPGEDPLGKRIGWGDPGNPDDPNGTWFTIVGVLGHALQQTLLEDIRIQFYFCNRQSPRGGGNLILRTTGEPLALVSAVRAAVLEIDSELPIANIATIEDLIAASIGDQRTIMLLLVIFALFAIILASLGIYGVMSQVVGERTREVGVRMACGATGSSVTGLLLRQGLILAALGTVTGLVAGVLAALLFGDSIRSLLYSVDPLDPFTMGIVTVLILAVATLSTLLPAIQAARLDPVNCLRTE